MIKVYYKWNLRLCLLNQIFTPVDPIKNEKSKIYLKD